MKDLFLQAAIEEARKGYKEGGIPIGSVLVYKNKIIGRGHNRRVQNGSVILHGEMDALENAGRLPASVYRDCTIYTTLSPCSTTSITPSSSSDPSPASYDFIAAPLLTFLFLTLLPRPF